MSGYVIAGPPTLRNTLPACIVHQSKSMVELVYGEGSRTVGEKVFETAPMGSQFTLGCRQSRGAGAFHVNAIPADPMGALCSVRGLNNGGGEAVVGRGLFGGPPHTSVLSQEPSWLKVALANHPSFEYRLLPPSQWRLSHRQERRRGRSQPIGRTTPDRHKRHGRCVCGCMPTHVSRFQLCTASHDPDGRRSVGSSVNASRPWNPWSRSVGPCSRHIVFCSGVRAAMATTEQMLQQMMVMQRTNSRVSRFCRTRRRNSRHSRPTTATPVQCAPDTAFPRDLAHGRQASAKCVAHGFARVCPDLCASPVASPGPGNHGGRPSWRDPRSTPSGPPKYRSDPESVRNPCL